MVLGMFTKRALVFASAFLLLAATPAQAQDKRPSDLVLSNAVRAQVLRVLDGNTIEVAAQGETFRVRYIGTHAPQINECFGTQAQRANAALVAGKTVFLEVDEQLTDVDGVALRYVYLPNGQMVNAALIGQGAARVMTQLPNTRYDAALRALEDQARQAKRGGWARCNWQAEPPPTDATGCFVLHIADVDQRTKRPSALGLLRAESCVRLLDEQGRSARFIYHPAGSVVTLGPGYLRWKDGFVLLSRREDGTLVAHDGEYRRTRVTVTFGGFTFTLPGRTVLVQGVLPLEPEPGLPDHLRLPMSRTWVAQQRGDGQVQLLVDWFEFVEGDLEVGLPR